MRAAGDGEAAAPAPPIAWRLGLSLAAVGLLFWALFFGGDSSDLGLTWLGSLALLVAAVALLGDAAVALGLWIARPGNSPRVRLAGAALIYVAVVSILLAYSRAGVLVAVVLVAGWLLFERDRLEALAAVTLGSGVAALVAGWAVTRPGLGDAGQ